MFKISIWGGSDQKTLYSPIITYMIIMQAGLKVNHFCIILIAILHFLQNFSHARETFMHCVLKKGKSKRGTGGKKKPRGGEENFHFRLILPGKKVIILVRRNQRKQEVRHEKIS